MRGSGQVRDLREAMSLSPDLAQWVQTYSVQSSRAGQVDLLDGLIQRWADTSLMKPLKEQALALADSGVSLTYHLRGLTPDTPEYEAFVTKLGIVERFMGFTYGGATGQARTTALSAELQTTAQAGILAISTGGEPAGPVNAPFTGTSSINPPAANQSHWLQAA